LIFNANPEDYVVPETLFAIVLGNKDYTHTFWVHANPITIFLKGMTSHTPGSQHNAPDKRYAVDSIRVRENPLGCFRHQRIITLGKITQNGSTHRVKYRNGPCMGG
jgi:hypothetical protein